MEASQSKNGQAWLLGVNLGEVEPCAEPMGWPEFTITLRFYVSSENPEVIERERQRIFHLIDADHFV